MTTRGRGFVNLLPIAVRFGGLVTHGERAIRRERVAQTDGDVFVDRARVSFTRDTELFQLVQNLMRLYL